MYHASLRRNTKEMIHGKFSKPESELRILVATIAYGLVCVHNNCCL